MPVYNRYYPDGNNRMDTQASVDSLALEDPSVPVTVSITEPLSQALQGLGITAPTPMSGTALIDTGASVCMIDEGILSSLQIPPLGATNIATPSGSAQQLTYPASLSFPGTNLPNVSFTDFVSGPLAAQGIIVLLGRDVLRDFVLIYNGPVGQITLSH
jgi:hypothetical protein